MKYVSRIGGGLKAESIIPQSMGRRFGLGLSITGATPTQSFRLFSHLNDPSLKIFNVLFEINQTWDWNEYWTNNKFPDDADYKSSSQPALVYRARVDLSHHNAEFPFTLIGHSHYSGEDGSLDPDGSTFTTALQITASIVLKSRK